jgi:membrane protease YdiL (CAAX protease family)
VRVAAFLALTFGLSWGWWGGMWLLGLRVTEGGEATHLPGLAGPLLAALSVTALLDGRAGLAGFLRRLIRMPPRTLWPILVAWPAAAACWHLAAVALDGGPEASALLAYPGLPVSWPLWIGPPVVLLLNGLGEEAGWRGFLTPLLAAAHGPFAGILAVATLWGLWHMPLFAIHDGFAAMLGLPVLGWALGLVCGAFVLSDLHERAGKTVMTPALWHVGYNYAVAPPAAGATLGAVLTMPVVIWGLAIAIQAWNGTWPKAGKGRSG